MDEPKKQQTRGLRRVEAGEGQYQSKHRTNTNPESVERAKVQKTEHQNTDEATTCNTTDRQAEASTQQEEERDTGEAHQGGTEQRQEVTRIETSE